jgi:hypothetical protein
MEALVLACLIVILLLAVWIVSSHSAQPATTVVTVPVASATPTPATTENLTPGQYMQIGRGFNALNTGGDYSGPIAELNDIEKMNLETVETGTS